MSDGRSPQTDRGTLFHQEGEKDNNVLFAMTKKHSQCNGVQYRELYTFSKPRQTGGRPLFHQEGEGGGQGQHVCYLAVKIK